VKCFGEIDARVVDERVDRSEFALATSAIFAAVAASRCFRRPTRVYLKLERADLVMFREFATTL